MLNRLFGKGPVAEMAAPDDVKDWAASGQAVIVDVREPHEHQAEAIPGAISLPLSVFDAARLPEVPEGKRLVFHCKSGVRCGAAAEQARQQGYQGPIYRLQGGIMGWKAAGGQTR